MADICISYSKNNILTVFKEEKKLKRKSWEKNTWKRRGICKKPKNSKTNISQAAKRVIVWGMEKRMRSTEVYIASVGSPSRRSIYIVRTCVALGTSGQVARVRTVSLTVRLVFVASVQTQPGTVRTIGLHSRQDSKRGPSGPLIRPDVNGDHRDAPHWNTRKTEENFTEIKFSQVSVRTRMYNQLITQSENISKRNRDIKESWDFN
jgi:hypothetical protein